MHHLVLEGEKASLQFARTAISAKCGVVIAFVPPSACDDISASSAPVTSSVRSTGQVGFLVSNICSIFSPMYLKLPHRAVELCVI